MVVENISEAVSLDKVSTVVPATSTTRNLFFLASCDLVCRSYPYINRLLFFKNSHGSSHEAIASLLQEGLARTLMGFYPLAGRFCFDEEGRLQIECGDEGVEFVEAACDLPFSLLLQDGFQYRSLFWKLARRTHYLRCDYLHEPILSVQVTKFPDGGFTVGVSMSHAVADAQSFYDFIKCWGETCRGVAMSVPPQHMRSALSVKVLFPTEEFEPEMCTKEEPNGYCKNGYESLTASDDDQVFAFSPHDPTLKQELLSSFMDTKEVENGNSVDVLVKELQQMGLVGKPPARLSKPGVKAPTRAQAPIMEKQLEEEDHRRPRSDLVQKVFSFSLEKLQRLKERANAGTLSKGVSIRGSSPGVEIPPLSFTTFEAFCAHWWQSFILARRLPPTQPVFLLIPINCRQRFLDLPKGYFGNALDGGLVRLTAGELCMAELRVIAGKIHEAIKAATEESFMQYIKEAERKRNAIPHFDRTGLFHVVDSPKYPVYEIDFGFGSPDAVRAEGFRFGAEVQILAGRLGSGSYDLFCALDSDTMQRLEHDPAFIAC